MKHHTFATHWRPRLITALALLAIFAMVLALGGVKSAAAQTVPPTPTITTDKLDYLPGATVILTGAGWAPGESVHILVDDDPNTYWSHSSIVDPEADSSGAFTYQFVLPDWFVAVYYVYATGTTSGLATTTFTDLNIGTYDQCSNDAGSGYADGCRWINGNLQRNNSVYLEGDATVQRLWLTDLVPGTSHTVTLKYGTTKGGRHTYDFLTTYDWSENWITLNDLCDAVTGTGTITGCTTASSMQYPIPDDPTVRNDTLPYGIEPVGGDGRQFTMAGGTITAASTPTIVSGDYTGDSETVITISYTVGPDTGSMCETKGSTTTCGVMLWFGAHVSVTGQWTLFNGTTGAATVSGSPYHVALDQVDGASVGQRDNQMQSDVITYIPNGHITIVKDAVPNDPQDFYFNLNNNFTIDLDPILDDDGDATLPNTMTFDVPPGIWYASEINIASGWTLTNLVCTDPTSNTAVNLTTGLATINLASNETVVCTYTDTKLVPLAVTKTANTSLTRTYSWTINKVADGEYWKFIGDPATTHNYNVSVDKTTTDSNWAVNGNIEIANNNPVPAIISGVTDTIFEVVTAAVTCPVTFPYTLAANSSLNCTYSAALPDATTRTNTATAAVTAESLIQGGSGTASVDFTSAAINPVGYNTINVTDSNGQSWGPVSDDASWNYTKDFSCPTDTSLYSGGVYNVPDAVNTATITETSASDTATVKLHCYTPVVSKTAAGAYTRTYDWSITKGPDGEYYRFAGESATHGYTVAVDRSFTDTPYVVSGLITVNNPNPNAAMTVSLTDSVGGTAATLDCGGTLTVPAGGSNTCGYSATLAAPTGGTNTATATLNSIGFSGTADYTFAETTIGSTSIGVTDTNGETWTASDDASWDYNETFTCSSNPALYAGDGTYDIVHSNTASIDGMAGKSADADVTVHCYAPLVSKTAVPSYTREYSWAINKSVTPGSHSGFAGDIFSSGYTVTVDQTVDDYDFAVAGVISIMNPNPSAAMPIASVADSLGGLAAACQSGFSIPASGTTTCTYTADMGDGDIPVGGTNVATVNLAAASFTAEAAYAFGDPTNVIGQASVNVTDTNGQSWTASGDKSWIYTEPFSCPTSISAYTSGVYTSRHDNTATITETSQTDSEIVTTTCYAPLVSKTAVPSYTREYSWAINKSVTPGSHSGFAGDIFSSGYTVTVDQTVDDYDFAVAGVISIMNPNPSAAMPIASVADSLGGLAAACQSGFSIPASGTTTCTYTADMGDGDIPVGGTNVATVNLAAASFTAEAAYAFGEPTNVIGQASVNVTDTNGQSWTASGDNSWIYTEPFSCPTSISAYTSGVYTSQHDNTATITETGQTDSEIVTTTCYAPLVSKTAVPSYTREYSWAINKSVTPGSHSGFAGDIFSSGYTVTVDQTVDDYDFAVAGVISIMNPNPSAAMPIASVVDSLGGLEAACEGAFSVPVGSTVECAYTADLGDGDIPVGGTNVATVNLAAASFTAEAAYAFGEPTTIEGFGDVNVTDTNGQSWTTSGDNSWIYTEQFSCPTNPSLYTNGAFTSTYPNTATITETGQDADALVTVNCVLPALQVTKTAAGVWNRDVYWMLEKSVLPPTLEGIAGASFPVVWTVDATKHDSGRYGFTVTGTISIHNPAAIAQSFTVTDVLNDAGATAGVVDCPSLTVASLDTVVCGYTASPVDATADLNTATVTAVGNMPQSDGDAIEWTENLTGSDSGSLTDPRFDYDEIISGTTSVNFNETFACSTNPADYTNGSYTDSFTNDTYFVNVNHDLHADASVGITCHLPALQVTKTASGEWDRTVTWDLAKTVDDASHTGLAGDIFGSTWSVVATKTDSGPKNFVVTGTISVTNPAAIAQNFTVADVLNDAEATAGVVTCTSLTVEPLGTVECMYSASPLDATADLNTATVTAVGNAAQTATATVGWTENLTGSDSGGLTDPLFDYDEIISGTTSVDFDETFACPTDRSRYTDGSYTESFTNNAYFLNVDHNLHADASVGITCYWPASARVVKATHEGAEDIGDFPFTFELYDPSGVMVEVKNLNAAGEITFTTELKTTGTWKVVEVMPVGWVSDDESLTCNVAIAFPDNAGQTITCNFTNTEMSRVSVLKLTQGAAVQGTPVGTVPYVPTWTFKLFVGPDGFNGGELVATDSTADGALLDFGNLNLDPYGQYTLCEVNVAAGWTSTWKFDLLSDGTMDVINPYNPNSSDVPSQDLGNRCVEIGAGTSFEFAPGETLAFEVDNSYPGGDPRTPGYWKNWNSCTNGGQYDNAIAQGGGAGGFWTLDELLNTPGFWVGDMHLDGVWDNDPFMYNEGTGDCSEAVKILDKSDAASGTKKASDAAYELATDLFAAKLNLAAGAETCTAVQTAVIDGQTLLDTIGFSGTGDYLLNNNKKTKAVYSLALSIAKTLDQYNNGLLCGENVEPPAPPPATDPMHVGDLSATAKLSKRGWGAVVTVTIHDESHGLVSGAAVSLAWGDSGGATCTTLDGVCSITINNIPASTGSLTVDVTYVAKDGFAYDLMANEEVSITINKP